jgi:hypothetical protein
MSYAPAGLISERTGGAGAMTMLLAWILILCLVFGVMAWIVQQLPIPDAAAMTGMSVGLALWFALVVVLVLNELRAGEG